MLDNNDLLLILNQHIGELQTQLNNNTIHIKSISHLDHYYTDGGSVGSLFKISPFEFYYTDHGIPLFGHWGRNYELYGAICNEWVSSICNEWIAGIKVDAP